MYCHLEWGHRGAARAGRRGDVVVIVDTLSFSTAVTAGVARGAHIYPTFDKAGAEDFAERVGAEAAVSREDVPSKGRFSLSPLTMSNVTNGLRLVLPSPNGARCSLAAKGSPLICAGTIVNSSSVAHLVFQEANELGRDISLVACGEAVDPYLADAPIRFALEDFLGTGAIVANVIADKSPELRAAEAAFAEALANLKAALLECESGQELIEMGYPQDVEFAAQHDSIDVVAVFDGARYAAGQSESCHE